MSTTVEQTAPVTDASGYYFVGQQRGQVKFKGIRSIFFNEDKIYNRIDQNWDGEISLNEIASELRNDIYRSKRSKSLCAAIALFCGMTAIAGGNRRMNTVLALINGVCAIVSHKQQKKAEANLERAREEIKLELAKLEEAKKAEESLKEANSTEITSEVIGENVTTD